MEPNQLSPSSSDHDILIELRTEFRGMRDDVKKASDDTKDRLLLLGANKLEKDQFGDFVKNDTLFKSDHENRMRRLERWGSLAIGALWIIQLLIGYFLIIHYNNH